MHASSFFTKISSNLSVGLAAAPSRFALSSSHFLPRKFLLTFFGGSWVDSVGSPVAYSLAWAAVLVMKRFHFGCPFNFNQRGMAVKFFFSNFLYTKQAQVVYKVKQCQQCISG